MKSQMKLLLHLIVKLAGREKIRQLIPIIANCADLNLLDVAYNNVGILKYENEMVSGEQFLIARVLKKYLVNIERPIIFDVGANIGNYSLMLMKEFPQAQIYAFEPNQHTFNQLVGNVGNLVTCVNAGMGEVEKIEKINTYADELASQHASIYSDIFITNYKRKDILSLNFQLTTLDHFCEREKVTNIDFLKIDTEGNEFNVLKGALNMLSTKKIKIIQFEFGECNVFSRVFLKDFYTMLIDYNIYRLDSERLIPLFEYVSTNEIFRFQNLIAVRNDFIIYDVK